MKKIKCVILMVLAGVCLFLCGCQPAGVRPGDEMTCPGKPSIEEAIRLLQLQKQNLQPFQASAECVITYQDGEGGQRREPVRSAKIAFVPDEKVYFKGELVFKELRFGTNETEFWLRIKADLEDFGDSYWWGARDDLKQCPQTLPVNPDNIAEAIGVIEVTSDWEMTNQDSYDILTLHEDGRIKKRIFINTCDYHIEQIKYFDSEGLKRVSVELNDYSAQENGILVPTRIKIVSYDRVCVPDLAVVFELKNIRPLPPEKIGKKLFKRPGRDGYEHLYRLDENCEFIEE